MAIRKIKIGDTVSVITGKSKGRTGRVLKFSTDRSGEKSRVIVEGVNMGKKHVKPNPQKEEKGGIIEREMPIHVSNVALLNPVTQKADKVGIKVEMVDVGNGRQKPKKVRFFKSNNEQVDI